MTRRSLIGDRLRDVAGSIFVVVFTLAVALIPFWGWLMAYYLLDPVGFWQKALVFGVGAWFLGVFQLLLLFVWLILMLKFFSDE